MLVVFIPWTLWPPISPYFESAYSVPSVSGMSPLFFSVSYFGLGLLGHLSTVSSAPSPKKWSDKSSTDIWPTNTSFPGWGTSGGNSTSGLVLEMEYRRKSGRGVREWYFLPHPALQKQESGGVKNRFSETVMLLEDHVLYRRPAEEKEQAGDDMDVTFELGLTDRQRQAREGVVLPYFDAQKGGGEGGRILYDMGEEDDFDEEEDEI